MILIIGSPEESHSAFIHEKIRARGEAAAFIDTTRFPLHSTITLSPDRNEVCFFEPVAGKKINLSEVRSVYWRTYTGISVPRSVSAPYERDMAFREIESCIGSMFRMMDCLWVNSPAAIEMHVYKAHQLQLLHRRHIRVPQTLVTNDAEALREFYERLDGKVIFKPVRGGAHTARLTDADFSPARLRELAQAPVQFQELIEGVDVRVYFVGGELFAAEIRSRTLDFRDDPDAEIVPIDLPAAVAADCVTLANTLGLEMSGIDVRRTPTGEYVFFEGNPAPMFMHFEERTGYPISERLVDLLIGGTGKDSL